MKLLTIIFVIACIMSPAQGQASSNERYLQMLAQAAASANLIITEKAKHCVERAITQIPESVKAKAAQVGSVDANVLRSAGVKQNDLNITIIATRPCMNQIAYDQRPKN